MKPHHLIACCLALAASAIAADGPAAPIEPKNELLQKVFATEPSGKPADIQKTRTTAQPGDAVTIKGRVMGNVKPFVDGRSIFIIGDPKVLNACNDKPGDGCKTPWDNCCDTPEQIKQGTATVQVIDAKGRVLREGIENVKGLAKLSHVVVSGKVAPGSSAELLLVNAEAIKVEETKK